MILISILSHSSFCVDRTLVNMGLKDDETSSLICEWNGVESSSELWQSVALTEKIDSIRKLWKRILKSKFIQKSCVRHIVENFGDIQNNDLPTSSYCTIHCRKLSRDPVQWPTCQFPKSAKDLCLRRRTKKEESKWVSEIIRKINRHR